MILIVRMLEPEAYGAGWNSGRSTGQGVKRQFMPITGCGILIKPAFLSLQGWQQASLRRSMGGGGWLACSPRFCPSDQVTLSLPHLSRDKASGASMQNFTFLKCHYHLQITPIFPLGSLQKYPFSDFLGSQEDDNSHLLPQMTFNEAVK